MHWGAMMTSENREEADRNAAEPIPETGTPSRGDKWAFPVPEGYRPYSEWMAKMAEEKPEPITTAPKSELRYAPPRGIAKVSAELDQLFGDNAKG